MEDQRRVSARILALTLALMATWGLGALRPDAAAAQVADPTRVTFTLEGCRPDAPITFPSTGPFVCPDANYTSGNPGRFWNEGDLVPFRITADNRGGAQTYNKVIAADYRLDDALGYDFITVPALNAALSSNDGLGCELAASDPGYAPPAGDAVGGIDQTIYRTLTITQPAGATCVYDYAQRLAIASAGRTAAELVGVPAPKGASAYPAASLHAYLLTQDLGSAGGQKRVPLNVDEIEPQGFGKTVEGVRGTRFAWAVTKSSGPAGFPDTCAGATTSGPVAVRVQWTKSRIAEGRVAVTTTFHFDNPAHRPLDVSVVDTLFTDATRTTTIDGPFVETYEVNPGHREFSVTRQVDTDSDTLFNTATATYTDPVTGDDFGQVVATDAGVVTTADDVVINDSATITDVEQITGGLTFSIESVSTDPDLAGAGFDPGYVLGTHTAGPVTWSSGTVYHSGSVTFTKLIHVERGVTTFGVLSDDATLQPSDTGAIGGHAETPIHAFGCGTVSGTKFDDDNHNGTHDANEAGLAGWTFYVDYDADGTLDQGERSAQSAADGSFTITGVKPGAFKLREVAQAGWICTAPDPCAYDVTLHGDSSTGHTFGNHQLESSIRLDKTGPGTAEAGSLVAYLIDVTNDGDLPFAASTVVVTDPLCTTTLSLRSKNGDATPSSLDPDEDRWTYTCSVQTQVGQRSVNNVAKVTAEDEFERKVSSTDNAVTTLTQPSAGTPPPVGTTPQKEASTPPVATASGNASSAGSTPVETPAPVIGPIAPPARVGGQGVVAGTAKLHGPKRCVPRSFMAYVAGKRIARVRFYVDGRLVATLTRSNRPAGRWGTRVDPAAYRAGKHRLVARIQFATASNTPEATQSFSFRRCGRAALLPAFTG